MNKFFDYMLKYGLHDCVVDKIYIKDHQIMFSFCSGVFKLDDFGRETELTAPCTMSVDVANLDNINNDILIEKRRKSCIKTIDFDKLINLMKKSKLEIHMNFLSSFCNTVLLQGYIEKSEIQITISQVNQILFEFN